MTIRTLEATALIPINIDVPSAIAVTSGKLPGIMALRGRAKALVELEVAAFDQLEMYTLATAHDHLKHMGASGAGDGPRAQRAGMKLPNTLYADAVAVATRNLIIGELKANIEYKNLAFDVMALPELLRDDCDKISTKTAITKDDLPSGCRAAEGFDGLRRGA